MKRFIIAFVIILCLPCISFAHSGGTDDSGGHNSPTGYHYHHGYPAHSHAGGCPYDYNDATDGYNYTHKVTAVERAEETSPSRLSYIKEYALKGLYYCACGYGIFLALSLIVSGIGHVTKSTLLETAGEFIFSIAGFFMMLPIAIFIYPPELIKWIKRKISK